ncbi:MAG: hypothetical protein ACI4M8_05160 [Christensenellales bacterium]
MNKQNKKFTDNYLIYEAAENESRFSSRDLSEELLPLLDDYFVGDFHLKDDGIVASFLNGQQFILSVNEL